MEAQALRRRQRGRHPLGWRRLADGGLEHGSIGRQRRQLETELDGRQAAAAFASQSKKNTTACSFEAWAGSYNGT